MDALADDVIRAIANRVVLAGEHPHDVAFDYNTTPAVVAAIVAARQGGGTPKDSGTVRPGQLRPAGRSQ